MPNQYNAVLVPVANTHQPIVDGNALVRSLWLGVNALLQVMDGFSLTVKE